MDEKNIYELITKAKDIELELIEIDKKNFGAERALTKIKETIAELLFLYGAITYDKNRRK